MADMLETINAALGALAERPLTADELSGGLSESARVMAEAFPLAAATCLTAVPWRFASFLKELRYVGYGDTSVDPRTFAAPGFSYAYKQPDDHLRTNWLRDIPDPQAFPINFHTEAGYWHTDTASLFVSYVSHQFLEPDKWPAYFTQVVAAYLAWKKAPRIRPAADGDTLRKAYDHEIDEAKAIDASETPMTFHGVGRLVRSRRGWYGRSSRLENG